MHLFPMRGARIWPPALAFYDGPAALRMPQAVLFLARLQASGLGFTGWKMWSL